MGTILEQPSGFHDGSGATLTKTSVLSGLAQTVQGPVNMCFSLLGFPSAIGGVKTHTLVPGKNSFFSLLYERLWRLTASEMFLRTKACVSSTLSCSLRT